MKTILIIISLQVICFTTLAQKTHIPQSVPFEDILIALQTDSLPLFKGAFSEQVTLDVSNDNEWRENLVEAKAKFNEKFQNYRLEDFTYQFDKASSKLVIFYKDEESFRMFVIKKNNQWKLNEH